MKKDLITRIFGKYRDDVDMRALWSEVDTFPGAHETQVMRLLFDNDGKPTGLTLKAVGQIIGVTLERIRQIREKSLRRLRHIMRVRL